MEKSGKTTATSILNDKNKINKLREYLILSLEAYKQGNPKQLNQVFEELTNDKVDPDIVKVWLNIFTKVLLDSMTHPKMDCSLIFDFILYKSRWFVSNSRHLEVFDFYQKFALALVSVKNSFLPVVMKLLAQNLVPKEMYEEESRSQNFRILIRNISFKNLKDLKLYVSTIMKNEKYDLKTLDATVELNEDHTKFILELFTHHPKAKEKLKGLTKILVGYNTVRAHPTKCFFIEKGTSHREDISYLKACNAVYDTLAEQNLNNLLDTNQKSMIEKVLNFLVKLLKLYPLSLNQLPSIVKDLFPHKRLDEVILRVFLINILKLTIKYEKVRTIILNICLENLIQIDVEIKSRKEELKKDSQNIEMAKKLDWLLLVFFDYLDYCFEVRDCSEKNCFGQIPNRQETNIEGTQKKRIQEIFFTLLEIFQTTLLMTYQSKYVQFIFFYLCSFVEVYSDFIQHFLSKIIMNIQSEEETKLVRINSIHYLRSIMTRANFIPFQVGYKALGYLVEFLKSYSKVTVKKERRKNIQSLEAARFEKIELHASSQYKDSLTAESTKEQESEYKNLFQKYDIFYYSIYALAYVLVRNCEIFVLNNRYEEYINFNALLVKYNSFFRTLKFFPKAFLLKLKGAHEKFNVENDKLKDLIEEELQEIENEEKTDDWRGDVFIEDYLPFDPYFLNRSKKFLISNYVFMENESEEDDRIEDEDREGDNVENIVEQTRVICDTLDDEAMSDILSSWSKHETDDSNQNSKTTARATLRRKNSSLGGYKEAEKRVKQNSDSLKNPIVEKEVK